MRLLTRPELLSMLSATLFLEPLLTRDQIGPISADLRLGYDFLVSVLTRRPAIAPHPSEQENKRGIHSYFQETRRRLGDRFVLYPHQVVLTTTVEYLCLPVDVYAEISVRSSYARLGIGVATTMQPGWRGAVPLEVFNHGNTPVEVVVGSCICQARFYRIENEENYLGVTGRKYFGTVRPTVSKADLDAELPILSRMSGA